MRKMFFAMICEYSHHYTLFSFDSNVVGSICGSGGSKQETDRKVAANNAEFNAPFNYKNNYIKTSKYNIITFLPLNLFLQFQRAANLYFLLQILIMSIKEISALNPASTAIPLTLVLFATLVKDGYDDWGRHVSDRKINNQETQVLNTNGQVDTCAWQDVQVGDIVRIKDDDSIPADIVVISTSEDTGLCFIETAELDGETNLKVRQPLPETASVLTSHKEVSSFNGQVTCELPNNVLDKFHGNLDWDDKKHSLDNNNVVLRGCVLRNTGWIFGLVIFAGHDTKLMMNSGRGVFKRTKLDRLTNSLVIWIAGFLALLCTFLSLMAYFWEDGTGKDFQLFLPWSSLYKDEPALIALINWPGNIMVLNTLIPISLYISVEVIRLGQSLLINWDVELYHPDTDVPAQARNTTLTEELGQIQYIFSDKTGTLTQNVMVFKECSINGQIYGHTPDAEMLDDVLLSDEKTPIDLVGINKYADPRFKFYDQTLIDTIQTKDPCAEEFFTLLALCHTVMVEDKEDKDEVDFVPAQGSSSPLIEYQAQSPDEGALVSAATNFGYVFKSRTPNTITIERDSKELTYDLLNVLDFDNVRKRMSVIVRRNDEYILYCKGADTIMYELLNEESEKLKNSTQEHLDTFACEGLRTLCLASKRLSQDEYENWLKLYTAASTAMENREELMFDAYCEMEQDMMLLGATAIEDKLQDGVPETIANLAEANIKIWVLTGDKQETAINIGYSSMLLTENMKDVFIIDGSDEKEVQLQIQDFSRKIASYEQTASTEPGSLVNQGARVSFSHHEKKDSLTLTLNVDDVSDVDPNAKEGFGLVISGKSLAFALLQHRELDFLELAKSCKAVICCRVTPLQKALVVDLVKRNVSATTLAIGDGANDVSMIKAAHIGVGISGKEGRQAVLAADYSFGQFRFLERLLLVHGRWSYWRMAKFLNYFFYKNFAFTLVQFWYSLFSAYSAATMYDTWFLSVYNVCFTSLPVLAMGILDQDVSDKNSLNYPKLYIHGQTGRLFNKKTFLWKLLHGIITSLLLFFVPYGIYHDMVDQDGLSHSNIEFIAVAIGCILVIVVNLQIALDTLHWTWINHFFIWGSIIFYFIYTFTLYSETLFKFMPATFPAVGAAVNTFGSFNFWAVLFLTSVLCLAPVVGYQWIMQKCTPTLAETIRRGMWKEKRSRSSLLFLRRQRRSLGSRPRSTRSAYAFSHQPGIGGLLMAHKWLPKKLKLKSRSFEVPRSTSGASTGRYKSTPAENEPLRSGSNTQSNANVKQLTPNENSPLNSSRT